MPHYCTLHVLAHRRTAQLTIASPSCSAMQEPSRSPRRSRGDRYWGIGPPTAPLSGTARINREGRVNNGNIWIALSGSSPRTDGSRAFAAMNLPIRGCCQNAQNWPQNGAFRGRWAIQPLGLPSAMVGACTVRLLPRGASLTAHHWNSHGISLCRGPTYRSVCYVIACSALYCIAAPESCLPAGRAFSSRNVSRAGPLAGPTPSHSGGSSRTNA